MFLDIPSLIIVLGFDICALLAGGSGKHFLQGLAVLVKNRQDAPAAELLRAAESWDLMYRCSIGSGFIGVLLGLVMMLVNLQEPSTIGPYLALCIITLLYGSILAFLLFLPGRTKLRNMAVK